MTDILCVQYLMLKKSKKSRTQVNKGSVYNVKKQNQSYIQIKIIEKINKEI